MTVPVVDGGVVGKAYTREKTLFSFVTLTKYVTRRGGDETLSI